MSTPLEDVYDAIWDCLEDWTAFTTYVPAGNRIKYHGDKQQPEKDEIADADCPEVRVKFDGIHGRPFSDSSNTGITVQFSVQVTSARQEMSRLLEVVWAILTGMMNWDTRLMALTWQGHDYVRECRLLQSDLDLDNRELNRGIRGWSTVWKGEIKMWFVNSELEVYGT